MRHGSLFSGIGGFDLAAEWMGWENIFHCEVEDYKRKKLNEIFKNSKSHGDITKTDFAIYRGGIDILTGGFPCQDASLAKQDGKGQQGLQGERTGLFWQMLRAIQEIKPKYIVAENVSNFLKINKGQDARTVFSELARLGYNAEWRICRASEVGAPHHRARLYLVAYPNSIRMQESETFFRYVQKKAQQIPWRSFGTTVQTFRGGSWLGEPPSLCVDNGLSGRLVRQQLHGYGNAVVPQVVYEIFKAIEQYERN